LTSSSARPIRHAASSSVRDDPEAVVGDAHRLQVMFTLARVNGEGTRVTLRIPGRVAWPL
jgi:hypothetical protein